MIASPTTVVVPATMVSPTDLRATLMATTMVTATAASAAARAIGEALGTSANNHRDDKTPNQNSHGPIHCSNLLGIDSLYPGSVTQLTHEAPLWPPSGLVPTEATPGHGRENARVALSK
jgi:hypothetical protein